MTILKYHTGYRHKNKSNTHSMLIQEKITSCQKHERNQKATITLGKKKKNSFGRRKTLIDPIISIISFTKENVLFFTWGKFNKFNKKLKQ